MMGSTYQKLQPEQLEAGLQRNTRSEKSSHSQRARSISPVPQRSKKQRVRGYVIGTLLILTIIFASLVSVSHCQKKLPRDYPIKDASPREYMEEMMDEVKEPTLGDAIGVPRIAIRQVATPVTTTDDTPSSTSEADEPTTTEVAPTTTAEEPTTTKEAETTSDKSTEEPTTTSEAEKTTEKLPTTTKAPSSTSDDTPTSTSGMSTTEDSSSSEPSSSELSSTKPARTSTSLPSSSSSGRSLPDNLPTSSSPSSSGPSPVTDSDEPVSSTFSGETRVPSFTSQEKSRDTERTKTASGSVEPSSTEESSTEESTTEKPTKTEEKAEKTSSAIKKTTTSTLAGGEVSIITATSWVDVEPSAQATEDSSQGDSPGLQDAGLALSSNSMLTIGVASMIGLVLF